MKGLVVLIATFCKLPIRQMLNANRIFERCRYLLGRLRGAIWSFAIRSAGGTCGAGLWVGKGVIWKYAPHAGIHIAKDVQFGEYCIVDVPPGGKLRIADFVKFSMGCVLAARECIAVGADTQFGEYCSLRDADHGMAVEIPMRLQCLVSEGISIGCDAWIGRGVAILRGAHIGNGVVVGANSLVLAGKLADMGVFVGSPCRFLKVRQ